MALKGSTVFCYSLASKKHKQVTMDKVRYAGDLSQDDAPDLLQAFPEEEPNVDDEMLEPNQVAEQPNTGKQTARSVLPTRSALPTQSCDQGMNNLQHRHKMRAPQHNTHRYSLRKR